ncbi:MAG: DNRLRE domain-containing protein [Planctomycetaceae bacterium]
MSVSTLAVGSDTFIMNHPNPEANLGGAATVRLYNGVGAVDRMLFQADLSNFAASGSQITSAVLELYQEGGFGNNSMSLSIYAVAQQWTEGTQTFASGTADGASWLQAQAGVAWTPGGELGGLVQVATLPAFVAAGWVQFDITATVRAWKDGQLANNGLAFVISSGGEYTEHRFTSSESSNTSLRPKLVVNVVDEPVTSHRSPVADFIQNHIRGTADGTERVGRIIREIAHQLQSRDHDSHPTGNPGKAGESQGKADDHNPTLGAALPSGLGKLKRAIG